MALPVNPSVRLLTTTLSQVAAALRSAHDPWWVIGSAAVWLHGVGTAVSDVDVLTSASASDTTTTHQWHPWHGAPPGAPDRTRRATR